MVNSSKNPYRVITKFNEFFKEYNAVGVYPNDKASKELTKLMLNLCENQDRYNTFLFAPCYVPYENFSQEQLEIFARCYDYSCCCKNKKYKFVLLC